MQPEASSASQSAKASQGKVARFLRSLAGQTILRLSIAVITAVIEHYLKW